MQVWNQVKVKAPGAFEGRAGVVIRADLANGVVTVKLDEIADPVTPSTVEVFAVDELLLLG